MRAAATRIFCSSAKSFRLFAARSLKIRNRRLLGRDPLTQFRRPRLVAAALELRGPPDRSLRLHARSSPRDPSRPARLRRQRSRRRRQQQQPPRLRCGGSVGAPGVERRGSRLGRGGLLASRLGQALPGARFRGRGEHRLPVALPASQEAAGALRRERRREENLRRGQVAHGPLVKELDLLFRQKTAAPSASSTSASRPSSRPRRRSGGSCTRVR